MVCPLMRVAWMQVTHELDEMTRAAKAGEAAAEELRAVDAQRAALQEQLDTAHSKLHDQEADATAALEDAAGVKADADGAVKAMERQLKLAGDEVESVKKALEGEERAHKVTRNVLREAQDAQQQAVYEVGVAEAARAGAERRAADARAAATAAEAAVAAVQYEVDAARAAVEAAETRAELAAASVDEAATHAAEEAAVTAQAMSARALTAEAAVDAANAAAAAASADAEAARAAAAGAAEQLRGACAAAAAALAAAPDAEAAPVPPLEQCTAGEAADAVHAHIAALAAALEAAAVSTPPPPPRLPQSLPAESGAESEREVALEMAPLLLHAGASSTTVGYPTGTPFLRREGNDSSRDLRDGSPHRGAGDTTMTWRPLRTIPMFRKLPPRLQSILGQADDAALVAGNAITETPALRVGAVAWVLVLHAWIMALHAVGCVV